MLYQVFDKLLFNYFNYSQFNERIFVLERNKVKQIKFSIVILGEKRIQIDLLASIHTLFSITQKTRVKTLTILRRERVSWNFQEENCWLSRRITLTSLNIRYNLKA